MVSAPVHGTEKLLLKQKQITSWLKMLGTYTPKDLQGTRSTLIPRSVDRFHQTLNLSWAPLRQSCTSLIAAEYMHCHFFSSRSARILCVYVRDRLKMACAGDNDGGLTLCTGTGRITQRLENHPRNTDSIRRNTLLTLELTYTSVD
jgi:hypothetical protein